jgi:hypothetical protein
MDQPSKPSSAAFWKAYFAKFRRPVEENEVSETVHAPLIAEPEPDDAPDASRSRRRERITLKRQTRQSKVD